VVVGLGSYSPTFVLLFIYLFILLKKQYKTDAWMCWY